MHFDSDAFGYLFKGRKWLCGLLAQLDRLLHGEREWKLEQYQEGELAILANEIQKLLKRLTEQTETLRRDKLSIVDILYGVIDPRVRCN